MSLPDPFEAERPRLKRLAYRMLGSVAEAEDVVQDAWLRWRSAKGIDEPAAWLTRVAARLCLDRLRADRAERAAYRGPWLPEPLIEDIAADPVERAEDISVAFLLALERLSPLERAVFLLHDVFDAGYPAIAETLERSESACRQLAARARAHLKDARPRFPASQDEVARLAVAFMDAARRNDLTALKGLLAEDAVMITDGGGKRKAALRPLVGPDDIARLIEGLVWRGAIPLEGQIAFARINGVFGVVLSAEGEVATVAFEPGETGKLAAIYMIRNPEKLAHVAR
ncbi:MAG TPA: RNA polymerase sigma factor SigJ [Caulobacteraceae bacterium]|nr:RNA polymerase sigma factor SigJ [Caulobacteraceae bacterium]